MRALAAVLVAVAVVEPASISLRAERVAINDNRVAAGTVRDGVLTVRLEARLAEWHPDGDEAPGAMVPAFAVEGEAAQIPGPMIRVPAGTDVVIRVSNAVPRDTLVVHGLHARPLAGEVAPLSIPSGAHADVRFRLEAPGTYYYWGTTMGRVFGHRTREDAQLSGAIVVDPPGTPPADRVLVLGIWTDTAGSATTGGLSNRMLFVVNGRTWPHTERFSYQVADTVRWRILNISADVHPMHLHGFYYRIHARGDGRGDTTYAEQNTDLVVTEFMSAGETMRMSWVPERPGNWLFHCHIPDHFAPRAGRGMRLPGEMEQGRAHHVTNHALEGMGGLVVGVHVTPDGNEVTDRTAGTRRRMRLLVREHPGETGAIPHFSFDVHEGGEEPALRSPRAGPPIVLARGEPVSITVVNRTPEPTAVHWHGMELESYFDGVAGFSGGGSRLSPVIAPADSFEALFTPPRAGTFIYHTHVDELRQQRAGLAGALVVLEPGAQLNDADAVVLITAPPGAADEPRAAMINGTLTPAPLTFRAGTAHRLRIINISATRPGLRVELRRGEQVADWRIVAKDGADLPPARRNFVRAYQPISIGETYDVEVTAAPGDLVLQVRTSPGRLMASVPIHAR